MIVPVRPLPKLQLSQIEFALVLNDTSDLTLKITGPSGASQQTRPMKLTDSAFDCFDAPTKPNKMACFAELPASGAPANDSILIVKAAHEDPTSPPADFRRLRVLLQFPRVDLANCTGGITSPERWTIEVLGGIHRIESANVISYDRGTLEPPTCTSSVPRVVLPTDPHTASFLLIPPEPGWGPIPCPPVLMKPDAAPAEAPKQ